MSRRARRKCRVILDHRNRELRYLRPDENATDAIRELRKRGLHPVRIIEKER
ncbi:MAG TPA: hypothetical protein PK114_04500 [Smithellaceae bacterium]|nr:hypothetical protein [Smithellaceae bacterium]HPK53697.1 hypothetical protein [Smithellaceae bacterium]HRS98125.1 hypothetical protein [Smithella sp.]